MINKEIRFMDKMYGMYGLQGQNPMAMGLMQGMGQMPMQQMPVQMDMYGQQQGGIKNALLTALRGQNGAA